jgi:outer membrane receptor protein involved in Fe transport
VNSDFEHSSNIYAIYAGYFYRGQKIGVRTGLRAEGTRQYVKYRLDESKNFDIDYSNVVPNITVSYQLKPTQQLRLGYSLRIFRPSIWHLNPYVNDTDPYNIRYGNPNLVPEKSHGLNANYSYFSPKITLNVSANYSYANNAIEYFTFILEDNPDVKYQTTDNIGRNHRASVYINATWTPNRVLRLTINGGLNYADLRSSARELSNSGLTGNTNVMAQVTLPKDFRINANAMYMSGYVMLQGKQSDYFFYNLSASKDLLEKKMTVSLSCTNPFNKYLSINATNSDEYFAGKATYSQPVREARISVSYRFGAMKEAIRRVQRSITSDDIKSGDSGGAPVGGQ